MEEQQDRIMELEAQVAAAAEDRRQRDMADAAARQLAANITRESAGTSA